MNATTLSSKNASTDTRLSDWGVIIITLIALLAGVLFKNSVENRSVSFSNAGISAQTPQGWLSSNVQGNDILHVTNPQSSGFGTTYTIQNIPIASGATVDQVASMLILERGQVMTAFRVLNQQQVTVYGQAAYEIDYVYVESNPNLTHNQTPNIVRGMDYLFMSGGHAIIVTYWADEKAYTSDLGRFQRFLGSLKF